MYCIYCGKKLQDGEECNCKAANPVVSQEKIPTQESASTNEFPSDSAAVFYETPLQNSSSYNYEADTTSGLSDKALRISKSPLVLVASILFFIGFCYNIFWNSFNLISLLFTIALALTFGYAASGSRKTSGLTFVSGVLIATIAILCVTFGLAFIGILLLTIFVPTAYNSIIDNFPNNQDFYINIFTTIPTFVWCIFLAVFVCIFIVSLFHLSSLRHNVIVLRTAVNDKVTFKPAKLFPTIILFILAIFSIVNSVLYIPVAESMGEVFSEFINDFLADTGYSFTFNLTNPVIYMVSGAIQSCLYIVLALINLHIYISFGKKDSYLKN